MGKSRDKGAEKFYLGSPLPKGIKRMSEQDDRHGCRTEWLYSDWHWAFGWLRRPELDVEAGGYCYEQPDGDLVIFESDLAKRTVFLDCMYDLDAGVRYLCMSHRPPIPTANRQHRD
jgi:hypothetical protein